jgi:CHRD domain
MRRFVSAFMATLMIVVLTAGTVLAANTTFSVNLKGENEPEAGDLDATGQAHLELLPETDMVCYSIKWSKVDENVTGAHIHVGPPGVNGGIVVTLFGGPLGDPTDFSGDKFATSDCVSADGTVIDQILADPSNYYVNVHTGADFHGVIRGQLK